MSEQMVSLAELERRLRAAGRDADRAIAPVIAATSAKVVDTQKQNIRVRSGRTRDSIAASGPDGKPLTATSIEAVIGPRPPWAHVGRWIERGTVRQAPHVYVANSFEPHRAAHTKLTGEAAIALVTKGKP